MTLKYIKISLAVALVFAITSCSDDYLNLDPSTSIPEEQVFSSFESANSALVGAYDQLSKYTFDGLFVPIMSDIIGEDVMINSVDNWNWFVSVYQLNILPSYIFADDPWWQGYKVIANANRIIENAPLIPDVSEEQVNQLLGGAKALRAYVMLKLVEMYAPAYSGNPEAPSIMLVTKTLSADDESLPRAPLSEVYEQIEKDLISAISLLEENDDKGFLDKKGAQAVLARAYLNTEQWEKARDMAIAAYTDLDLATGTELLSGFNYRNSETIFTVAFTPEDNNVYNSIPSFYYPVSGYSSMRANKDFVDLYSTSDIRGYFFLLEPLIDPNRYLILKFTHNQLVGNAERISIRASEMYLIEAECEAHLGNYDNAQDALFAIQERANPIARKSTSTGQALIDEILLERRKELFGEGFRWNDIKRTQGRFTREGDHWVKFDFGPEDEDYYRLTFPIPQSELDANSNISESDQNTGY
ncbi:RagB/SusD family nutrient uptake outer membrane protein [Prolixibacteraceae bacterium Z1-6]|uniref:RagB/SusD family nutrient uptake outer membrane protein n=1 Tax=Draconibacterium aestuarii TaxID=2998507 RepID=A0A9X3J416_9BACT|nr:RagB/SusD family nutrient uptake outer membrane protein [Prolixibacteraceae bacterium Z1-6]